MRDRIIQEKKLKNAEWREANKERIREYNKRYREEHKEEIRQQEKKYKLEHKEHIREVSKKWNEKNKEHRAEKKREWVEKNAEHVKAYAEEWEKNNKEKRRRINDKSKANHPHECYAHNQINNAIKLGKLIRKPCEVCGTEPTDAHHDDYNKPLEVRWLCKRCHVEWHKDNEPIRKEAICLK